MAVEENLPPSPQAFDEAAKAEGITIHDQIKPADNSILLTLVWHVGAEVPALVGITMGGDLANQIAERDATEKGTWSPGDPTDVWHARDGSVRYFVTEMEVYQGKESS